MNSKHLSLSYCTYIYKYMITPLPAYFHVTHTHNDHSCLSLQSCCWSIVNWSSCWDIVWQEFKLAATLVRTAFLVNLSFFFSMPSSISYSACMFYLCHLHVIVFSFLCQTSFTLLSSSFFLLPSPLSYHSSFFLFSNCSFSSFTSPPSPPTGIVMSYVRWTLFTCHPHSVSLVCHFYSDLLNRWRMLMWPDWWTNKRLEERCMCVVVCLCMWFHAWGVWCPCSFAMQCSSTWW